MSSESDLPALRQQVAEITGGARPRAVLAELAQSMASELAQYFEDLPMHPFTGIAARDGLFRYIAPRIVRHRVLLGRYRSVLHSAPYGERMERSYATIDVVAIGEDGVLRCGKWEGFVKYAQDNRPPIAPIDWSDSRIRNVPTRALVLRRWTGTAEPRQVAPPDQVMEALIRVANRVAAESQRDLGLLKTLL